MGSCCKSRIFSSDKLPDVDYGGNSGPVLGFADPFFREPYGRIFEGVTVPEQERCRVLFSVQEPGSIPSRLIGNLLPSEHDEFMMEPYEARAAGWRNRG